MSELKKKVDKAIKMMRSFEPLALEMCPTGFHLGFSGGKDSVVLYYLAKLAGVKFTANMSLTTIDIPGVLRFVRQNYPDIIYHRPSINFFELIKKKKSLPTRMTRYCCHVLKEQAGANTVTLLGIRKSESVSRSKRRDVEISNHKYSNSFDQFSIDKPQLISCVGGKDKIMLMPMLDITDKELWLFINSEKIEVSDLYFQGYHRLGCLFCPMSSKRTKMLDSQLFPKVANQIIQSIQYLQTNNNYFKNYPYAKANDIFHWWISNESTKIWFSNFNHPKLFNLN